LTDPKIIILDYQNNYVGCLNNDNAVKSLTF